MIRKLAIFLFAVASTFAIATPEFVEHFADHQVFGESAGVTMREPEFVRETENADVWIRIGYSFYYTDVAIYYTIDDSTPNGSHGVGSGSTQVLRSSAGQVNFVRNESTGPGTVDWWKSTLPSSTLAYGARVKYRIGAWHSGGGPEIWSNNYGCSDGSCDDSSDTPITYEFVIKLAWPGQGSAFTNHTVGYPPVYFWKEEAVAGNNYLNAQIDQNGTLYDIYYPSAGCANGVGTKNEGYVDGPDTFPPGLPLGSRGQMNFNQAMAGLRVDGKTYWLSNQTGGDFSSVSQSYVDHSNTISTSSNLTAAGNNIRIDQQDFAPAGINFPTTLGGVPNRGIYIKRFVLTNNGSSSKTINFYYYVDPALNGGDGFDGMYSDPSRGAMVIFDNAGGTASSRGEYNPTSFGDYSKNCSLYFGVGVKVCNSVGGSSGSIPSDFWRDTSADNGQGWSGMKLSLVPGESKEVDVAIVGGFDQGAGMTGTYDWQIAPALDWFNSHSMADIFGQTNAYWQSWLDQGTTLATPNDTYNRLFERSLLATALHLDATGGGVVAGMHNGAYPFVWPRDAVYAAVTLDKTGHFADSENVYRFLREVAYRGNEPFGKGFFYQKYTTDGYIVWNSPQVDETAVVPWGVRQHFLSTGDGAFLNQNYPMVYDSARSSSEDSSIDSRLYFDDGNNLMHSMNVWEDSFDDFIYSNANVIRGLKDAAALATQTGHGGDAAQFVTRSNSILSGLRGRLAWNGENTDISQLGCVYPFQVLLPNDPDSLRILNRINGTATDAFGNTHPLVNNGGEWQGLINRYWGDSYWNGGPWCLSTLWYGLAAMEHADIAAGKSDADLNKEKIDLLIDRLGPAGFGAEQIAPSNSRQYANFHLQAAWPNAWESMSTMLDSLISFIDFTPNAADNSFIVEPKLPSAWPSMTVNNLRVGSHRINLSVNEALRRATYTYTNLSGAVVGSSTWIRLPIGARALSATVNGNATSFIRDSSANRVRVDTPLASGPSAQTVIRVTWVYLKPVGSKLDP